MDGNTQTPISPLYRISREQNRSGSYIIFGVFCSLIWVPMVYMVFWVYQNKAFFGAVDQYMREQVAAATQTGGKRKVKPVIIKNEKIKQLEKRKYIPVYSMKDSAGQGGYTKHKGHSVLSPYDEFSMAETVTKQYKQTGLEAQKLKSGGAGIAIEIIDREIEGQEERQGRVQKMTKIPSTADVRPQQLMRWDSARQTFVPTMAHPAAEYLRTMFQDIRGRLALPGGMPQIRVDRYGCQTLQSIKPQTFTVAMLLDRNGNVIDVKITDLPLQPVVGQSFVEAIEGKSFGALPEAIKDDPWLLGIGVSIPDISALCRAYRRAQ